MRTAKRALWAIESFIAVNMIYLSAKPLFEDFETGFDPEPGQSNVAYFIQGAGLGTSGFWLRLVAIIASLVLILNWPKEGRNVVRLKRRTWSNLVLFALFIYVTMIVLIFVPGSFVDMLWINSFSYAVIMGIGYFANSAEIRTFNRIKQFRESARNREIS
jgi:hypothetical protein